MRKRSGHVTWDLAFPIKALRKYNGFLGIASTVNGEFILARSRTNGEYVDYFKEIFGNLTDNKETIERTFRRNITVHSHLKYYTWATDISLTLTRIPILDAIENTYDIGGIDVNRSFSDMALEQLVIESDFIRKNSVETFDDIETFTRYIMVSCENRTLEGLCGWGHKRDSCSRWSMTFIVSWNTYAH